MKMKRPVEDIIKFLNLSTSPRNYPNGFAIMTLIERVYTEGYQDGRLDGLDDDDWNPEYKEKTK